MSDSLLNVYVRTRNTYARDRRTAGTSRLAICQRCGGPFIAPPRVASSLLVVHATQGLAALNSLPVAG